MALVVGMLARQNGKGTSNMKRAQLVFTAALTVATLAVAGCSKKESGQSPPPAPTISKPVPPSAPVPSPATPDVKPAPVTPSPAASDANAPAGDDQTPAQLAAQVKQLESDYQNATDLQKRVVTIYDLSAVDSPVTIDAIGRLFLKEKDEELKTELINSLNDIDGQNDKKLAILSSAVRADQPKDVRLEAIDGMAAMDDKRGIQVLQAFVNDSDEEIREAVHDTIEQLQMTAEPAQ
jgi:type IV secretory pathway VirB10-like protein